MTDIISHYKPLGYTFSLLVWSKQDSPPNLSDLSLHLVDIFVERVDEMSLQVHEVLKVGRG